MKSQLLTWPSNNLEDSTNQILNRKLNLNQTKNNKLKRSIEKNNH